MTYYTVFRKIRLCLPLFYFLLGCAPGSTDNPHDQEPGKAISEPAIHTVEISQMKFNPSELKVRKGDQILFINHDMVTHDITEETKKAWHSPPLAPGQQWVFTPLEPASFYCSIHVVMKGKIRIE